MLATAESATKVPIRWHLLYAAMAVFLGLGLYAIMLPTLPVHELRSVHVDVLNRDQRGMVELLVTTTSVRREACPTTINRYFTHLGSSKVVVMTNQGNQVAPVGKASEVKVQLRPAEPFPPGEWSYYALAINHCREGAFVAPSPVAYFTVE
jgi:hypothetical protein